MAPDTYAADVYQDGRWWMIDIPEIGQVTQARRPHEIETMARDCIAVTLNVPSESFDLVLHRHPLGWKPSNEDRTIPVDHIAGWYELAELLHTHRRIIAGWADRKTQGFPKPIAHISAGTLFDAREVVLWWINWPSEQRARQGLPKTGHVDAETLERFGIEPTTTGANNGQQT